MSLKGFAYLVEALEVLVRDSSLKQRPIVLAFGGDGYIREEMDRVRQKGLEKHVLFLPFTKDVEATLKGLDVVAMPSVSEACGLLAMEAMVAGVPVIGTDCTGLREVLKDTPATIVPARNSVALARAIRSAMEDVDRSRTEAFADEAARRFDVGKEAAQLEKLMLSLLNGSGGTLSA